MTTLHSASAETPFFSICIPQYNRTDFLIEALRSFSSQVMRDFEVCISDGGSTDGGLAKINAFLEQSGMRYRVARSSTNLRYDANLRASIGLSTGKYVLLMGNDDALADNETLRFLHNVILAQPGVAAAITNYLDLSSNTQWRRMTSTAVLGAGSETAIATFRHYAFVGGIVFDGQQAREAATEACDGSEMYQMYLGSRLVAAGGSLLSIDRVCVHKDIQIPNQRVDSYKDFKREKGWPVSERRLPMGRILATVALGLELGAPNSPTPRVVAVARQLYMFTYPFWIFEYRRVESFEYSLGVYLALRPSNIAYGLRVAWWDEAALWALYLLIGATCFLTPLAIFDVLRRPLYKIAKWTRRR